MRNIVTAFLVFVIAGCTSNAKNASGKIADPEVVVEQTTGVPAAAEHVSGPLPVKLRLTVTNRATITIRLRSALVTSVGVGAWDIPALQQAFEQEIVPGATESFEFWIRAVASPTITGANGPVTLRVTTRYDSAAGAFQNTVTQKVAAP